jgi:hypothetical protein
LIIATGSRRKRRETVDGQKSMVSLRRERLVSGHRRIVCHRSSHAEDRRGGVAVEVEARRMVSEKIEAGLALQALALTGGLGLTASSAATKMLRTTDAKCVRTDAGWQRDEPSVGAELLGVSIVPIWRCLVHNLLAFLAVELLESQMQ